MIKKLIRQMLTAQVFSALTVSLCLLIDNIMIGRFLGEQAIAAYGLANPLLLVIGAIGSLLSAGIQVACSRSLGRGSQEETNAGYSSAVAVAGAVSVLFLAATLIFRSPFATALGAGSEGFLFEQTRDYLAGFSIGAPGSMGALVLVPFLQIAGQSNLLIAAVLTMTVTDVGLDLLNVLVFHGGMFGMGLASALSYYAAMIVGGFYFLSKKCVFRFSTRLITRKKIAELFTGGVPAGFGMASTVVMIFLINRILIGIGGSDGLAAFTVITTVSNSAFCIVTGIGGVSLTLSGIFYNEEDRSTLWETLRCLFRHGVVLGLGMGAVLLVFAPALVSLFIPEAGETRDLAILGLRISAAGLIPCCFSNALKNAYQGTERVALTELISVLEGTVFPVLAAFVFSLFMGTRGVLLYYALGEALALLFAALLVRCVSGRAPWRGDACLLLREGFGVCPEDLMETDIHDLREVTAAAEQAEAFCRAHGGDARLSSHIALCVEEMAGNVIQHGFGQDSRPHHLSIRILNKPDQWVLRFRDDCRAFDPLHYAPAEGGQSLGIRLTLAMAEDARYTYSMNLNNLVLKLPKS